MRDWLSRLVDPHAIRAFLRRIHTPELRLALRLTLPAALLAVVLRAWLISQMPAAFVHNDTATTVETAHTLLARHSFVLEGKKTFLTPLLCCVPALLHIPILPFLAVVQHLLGVACVFLGGLLVFAWFRFWRWLIIPATMLLAVNPVMLWYEHTALAEACSIFGVLLVALTATAFTRFPNRYTLALLLLAILFIAGSRPEGRLFALFAAALVARVFWGNWRPFGIALAATLAWTAFVFAITRTSQSGLLLLTSVIQLAPEKLVASPHLAEKLSDLSAEARSAWTRTKPPKLVPLRRKISRRIADLTGSENLVDSTCKRAGLEIALRNLPALPGLALQKFVIAHRELPSGDFTDYIVDGQLDALYDNGDEQKNLICAPLLWGRSFASENDAREYFQATCKPSPALTHWLETFVTSGLAPLAAISLPGSAVKNVAISGLPWLYTLALAGLLTLAFRDPHPLNFHQLWGAFLLCLWLVLMVTANIRARFRVLFEPLWILYAFALLDSVLILLSRFRQPRHAS